MTENKPKILTSSDIKNLAGHSCNGECGCNCGRAYSKETGDVVLMRGGYIGRAPQCKCFSPPVAPAPTASATDAAKEWLAQYLAKKCEVDIVETRKIVTNGWWAQELELLSAFGTAQSDKLRGLGQEAAEKLYAEQFPNVHDARHKTAWTNEQAAIIDNSVAERLKK